MTPTARRSRSIPNGQNAETPSFESLSLHCAIIEQLELGALKPFAANPRRHSRENVQKIARSIQTYGWTTPVLINDALEVIAGHGRLLAAQQLGIKLIPCIRLSHLTPELVKAYRLADNRLALDSEWDDQLLAEVIRGLAADINFDLTLTGFDQDEIEDFLFSPVTGLTGEDDVPAPADETVSAAGDIWQLGEHRLMCGDCTSPVSVARLLDGQTPVIMVTDPPYGVDYDPIWREQVGHSEMGPQSKGLVLNDRRNDWREAWALFHGPIAYVWHGSLFASSVWESLLVCGFEVRSQIIWVKPIIIFGQGHYHWQHEPCWYAVRKGATGCWAGDGKQSSVWQIDSMHIMGNVRGDEDNLVTEHSTQKPVECMRRPLVNHTRPGELCYDPFMGSGTTLIAAQSLKRRAYGLEINPAYVDIAIRRWQTYTGERARLVVNGDKAPGGAGDTFDEVAQWRKTGSFVLSRGE